MYLDYAEDQARRHNPMHMADWVKKLDAFLEFNERNVLTHAGKVSHQLAEEHAQDQFERFDAERRRLQTTQPASDFDKAIEEVKRLETTQSDEPSSSGKSNKKKVPRPPKPDEEQNEN
jgi:hypothetical protein